MAARAARSCSCLARAGRTALACDAGPVKIYAPSSCIREWVIMNDPNGNNIVNQPTDWHSCS